MGHVESAQVPWQRRKYEEHVNVKGLWPMNFFGQKLSKKLSNSGIFYYKFPNFGKKSSKIGGLNFFCLGGCHHIYVY